MSSKCIVYFFILLEIQTGILCAKLNYQNDAVATNCTQKYFKFRNMDADEMTDQFPALPCSSPPEVQKTLELTNIFSLYNPAADTMEIKKQFKNITGSKHKVTNIADPAQLDLSGDFNTQVETIIENVRLTREEVKQRVQVYADVERILSELWPGCVAIPFGSLTNGLASKWSDADFYFDVPSRFHRPQTTFVEEAKQKLQQYPELFADIKSMLTPIVPYVNLYHIPTNTNCDVNFNTPLTSKLVRFLLNYDPKLIPIAVIIKYWAKVHGLTEKWKLSKYSLTMLLVFYLQQPPASILPSVNSLQRDPADYCLVNIWNTGFMNKRELKKSTTSLVDLLGRFFEFYSNFNFEETVVCPYLGYPIRKEAFQNLDTLPSDFALYKKNVKGHYTLPLDVSTVFCIQDPIEQSRNSALEVRMATKIIEYFKFAANAYRKDKLYNGQNFLKTILTERPDSINR